MKYVYIAIGILLAAVLAFAVAKKVSPVSWDWWGDINTTSGVALDGHDPVAYFDVGAPVAGKAEFSLEWGGANWQFSNAANRDAFAADPERYAPQFGGFCSFAVSKGFTAAASPEAWHVAGDKLYVFADENVRDDWVDQLDDGSLEASENNWARR